MLPSGSHPASKLFKMEIVFTLLANRFIQSCNVIMLSPQKVEDLIVALNFA